MARGTRSLWYDIEGNPITPDQAEILLQDNAGRKIRVDYVHVSLGTFRVSTIHLVGNYDYDGPVPLIFETKVFLNGSEDEAMRVRWSTREQAVEGHVTLVRDITELGDIPAWAKEE